ncbi:unnamed protein product [Closterium sp. NIES-65]|nr:unnamed protein product [Closterium sp. NIES-65]
MDGSPERDPDHPRFIQTVQRHPEVSLSDPTPVLPAASPFRTPDPPRTPHLPPFPGRIARFAVAGSPGQLPRAYSGNTIPGAASSSSSSGATGSSAQSRQSGLRLTRRLDLAVAESGVAGGEGSGLRGNSSTTIGSGGGVREQRGRKQRRILPSEDEVKAAAAGHLGGHVAGHFGGHVAGQSAGHVAGHAAAFPRFFGGSSFGAAGGGSGGEGFPGGSTNHAADLDVLRHGSDLHSQLAHLLQQNSAAANPSAAAAAATTTLEGNATTLHALGLGGSAGFRQGGEGGQIGARQIEGGRIEGGVSVGEMERGLLWDMGGGMDTRMGGMGGLGRGMGGGLGRVMSGGIMGESNEGMNRLEGMRGGWMAGQGTAPLPSVNPTDSLSASLSLNAATAADFHRAAPGFCMAGPLQPLAGGSLGDSGSGGGLLYECRFCGKGFAQSQALGGHMNTHRRGWLGVGEIGEEKRGVGGEWGGGGEGAGGKGRGGGGRGEGEVEARSGADASESGNLTAERCKVSEKTSAVAGALLVHFWCTSGALLGTSMLQPGAMAHAGSIMASLLAHLSFPNFFPNFPPCSARLGAGEAQLLLALSQGTPVLQPGGMVQAQAAATVEPNPAAAAGAMQTAMRGQERSSLLQNPSLQAPSPQDPSIAALLAHAQNQAAAGIMQTATQVQGPSHHAPSFHAPSFHAPSLHCRPLQGPSFAALLAQVQNRAAAQQQAAVQQQAAAQHQAAAQQQAAAQHQSGTALTGRAAHAISSGDRRPFEKSPFEATEKSPSAHVVAGGINQAKNLTGVKRACGVKGKERLQVGG